MGVLVTSAVPRLRCPEEANLRAPESVVTLHTSFIRAGADLIETNTFGANRRKLSQLYLEDEFERINSAGVKLAREAREVAGRDVFIAGSIGPLGDLAVPPAQRSELFAEQASLLDGRGIDLFMVETFYDLDELEAAIEAVRGVSSLPIVATLTFDEGAETLAGVSAADAAARLRPLGLAAIGANHGAGLHAALAALEAMGADGGPPLAALPNVGLASLSGGRVIYPHATPEYFAEFAAHARQLGARLIGGCCGTTPLEIAAIASAVEEERKPSAPLDVVERELVEPRLERGAYETELARQLREGEWVTCVELDPPKGGTYDAMLAVARELKRSGKVGFVDINDNPMARARANALMAAVAIERDCGIETIPHVTPRDSSIMGLESQLLGAHAEGVRNVLAVTGDPPEIGDYPGSQRRLRGRLDRPLAGRLEAQPGRGLQRQGHRRADLVLPRRGRQPVGRRPRGRGRALPPEDRGRRELRDDAGALRPLLPRPLRGADRRLAGAAAARDLLRAQLPARGAAAQRGAGDRRARGRSSGGWSRPARTRAPRASRWRASSTPRRARRWRGST